MLLKTKGIYAFIFVFVTYLSFAQPLYKETAEINDSVDYYLEIAIFNKDDKKSYNKAIIYTEKAIAYANKNNLEQKLGDCYLVLGRIYFDVKKIDNAIENLIRSINFYSKKESSYNLAFAYYNLGKCYLEIEKNELSEIYFKKASDIYESLNLLDAIQLINLQKGIIQKNKKQFIAANQLFEEVINKIESSTLIDAKVEAYLMLGEIQDLQGNYSKGIEYLETAYALNSSVSKSSTLQQKIVKELMLAYKNNKQFKEH